VIETGNAMDDKAQPTSNTHRVYQKLRQQIITGEIPPGNRLKVDVLKSSLEAGASPIREALSLLTSDQLVERIDQRGFRTSPVSEAQFQEILTLRCQLEELALRSSINNGDTQWEEQLVLAHHRLHRAKREPLIDWEELHKSFHQALLKACDSPVLLRFCDQLYDLNIRYRFLAGMSNTYKKRNIIDEHQLIMEAVVARSSDEAVKLLGDHYTRTGHYLSDQLAHIVNSTTLE